MSLPAVSAATDVLGKTGAPPVVATLKATSKVWGIHLEWSFPAGTDDTQRTEVWRSTTPNLLDATKLADLAYPQNSLDIDGLAAGVSFYFWVRLVDKTGNIGAFYPNGTGLPAQSSSSQADYEPVIAGLIGQTELGQQILEGVDLATSDMAGDAGEWAGHNGHFAGTWTLLDAVQDGDRSMAKRVDLVQAAVDNTTAAVQQTSQAVVDLNGKVSATWTVKCQVSSDGRIYAAGMGLGVEQQPDGSYQSQALFQADRFAVINTANNRVTVPFVIQNGQTYIQQALIGDGWINNAMIGDYIQSTDYVANQRGWKISKSGNSFELNGSGGGRLQITNQLIQVFDAAGTLRVRLGIW